MISIRLIPSTASSETVAQEQCFSKTVREYIKKSVQIPTHAYKLLECLTEFATPSGQENLGNQEKFQ